MATDAENSLVYDAISGISGKVATARDAFESGKTRCVEFRIAQVIDPPCQPAAFLPWLPTPPAGLPSSLRHCTRCF
jgi:hypothetical protein